MAADRRPGNPAHLERLLNAWSRENTEVQATAGRLRWLVAISVLATGGRPMRMPPRAGRSWQTLRLELCEQVLCVARHGDRHGRLVGSDGKGLHGELDAGRSGRCE